MKYASLLIAALLWLPSGNAADADSPAAGSTADWFYMVRSRPADPARESEYNRWYDDIDIPDVLAVPGFMRARRAVAQRPSEESTTAGYKDKGRYVALYDISTNNIDKTIIDLYVAARKMTALGRLTDALKVTEANYYRRLAQHAGSDVTHGSQDRYIYTRKILCCRDPRLREEFLNWYQGTLVKALLESGDLQRVSLYELYRVMEVVAVPPDEIPHLLMVFELSAPTGVDSIERMISTLRATGRWHEGYAEGESLLYRQMSDVESR